MTAWLLPSPDPLAWCWSAHRTTRPLSRHRTTSSRASSNRSPPPFSVVIDEAYREFVPNPGVPDGVDVFRNRPNARFCGPSPRVTAELRRLGWKLLDSDANFVWLRLGVRSADFAHACEEAGVRVRPFSDQGVRVTMGETAANDRFLQVAEHWRHHVGP